MSWHGIFILFDSLLCTTRTEQYSCSARKWLSSITYHYRAAVQFIGMQFYRINDSEIVQKRLNGCLENKNPTLANVSLAKCPFITFIYFSVLPENVQYLVGLLMIAELCGDDFERNGRN